MPTVKCYLCGNLIEGETSGDHVIPKAMLDGRQPRVKGFDYAGKLPKHAKCNNEFGPEIYVAKALDVISAVHDERCYFKYPHPENLTFMMMALNSSCLPAFTKRELAFFKITDVQSKSNSELHDLSLLKDRPPVDLKRQALFTALAVLTKSAAALLVSRKIKYVPSHWDVLAIPYVGEADAVNFDDLFGSTEPFDIGVKVWLAALETEDFLVIYRARKVIVFFLFRFSANPEAWTRMLSGFKNATRLQFKSPVLRDLVDYEWEIVR